MATSETAALTQAQIDRGAAPQGDAKDVNVGEVERWASTIGGGALAIYGLTRGTYGGVALALLGASLVYRGTTGHCHVYQMTGLDTSEKEGDNPFVSVAGGHGVKVEKSITIDKSPEELYKFWLNFENLPNFMDHLKEVRTTGDGSSHWVAKGPVGLNVEWEAETFNLKENEMIAWRSLAGSQVDNAGSVHFTPGAGGQGTQVRVVLKYDPPAGALGAWVAKLFGESPEQQVESDLARFKELMEGGGKATS